MTMSSILSFIVWGAAFFFAGTWTIGMLISPSHRLKSNVAAVVLWWALIMLALADVYQVFHLIWLMPLSLFVPLVFMTAGIGSRFGMTFLAILLKSGITIGIAVAALVYLGT